MDYIYMYSMINSKFLLNIIIIYHLFHLYIFIHNTDLAHSLLYLYNFILLSVFFIKMYSNLHYYMNYISLFYILTIIIKINPLF